MISAVLEFMVLKYLEIAENYTAIRTKKILAKETCEEAWI
jgi:hypothetical protein